MYYLQSRYYDPQIGRFINADSYASTGQGFVGYNMFAYCGNNPVCYGDDTGEIPWVVILGVVACATAIGVDHYLAKNHPEGLSHKEVREDDRVLSGVYSKARVGFAKGNGFEFDDKNGITICDLEVGMFETSYGTDYLRVSALNGLTAKADISADWSGGFSAEISGLLSIYSANAKCIVLVPGGNVTVSGAVHVGAIGAGYEFDPKEGKFSKIMPGIIPGLVFEWEVDYEMAS